MNKTEALAKLAALEAETAALRKIIEAPEAKPSLLYNPTPGKYWQIGSGGFGGTRAYVNTNSRPEGDQFGGNIFQSEPLAQAYADAIETMLLLRHQPGTEAAKSHTSQYVIREEDTGGVYIHSFNSIQAKQTEISPCFSTKEAAEQAIQTVGAERIMRMFKAFHHVED